MMRDGISGNNNNLPPGLLFSPTDEELVLHFLYYKASSDHHLLPSHPNNIIIPDLHLSLSDPWELNGKALWSGNQYYFFSKVKEERSTENGYWKEIGVSEPILSSSAVDHKKVGVKKYLVFHIGQAPHATQTSWVMQEYHICSSTRQHDQSWSRWVLCRVYEKNCYSDHGDDDDDNGTELSWLDEVYLSLEDDLEDIISSIPS